MQPPIPLTRDLVFVGGGHCHALVLKMWAMKPLPGVRLTLINPDPSAAYSGMLPGHVAGHYPRAALQIDLVRLARHAGARLILGRAVAIDRAARRVIVPGRAAIAYDIASIDIGITSAMPAIPGFSEHAVPVKPLDGFADRWQAFCAAATGSAPRVAVIGGGVAGMELALAAAHRLGRGARVTVIEAASPLAALGRGAAAALLAHARRLGVTVTGNAPVTAVEAGAVILADGRRIAADFILGTAATFPAPWLAETGLALDQGFVRVTPFLQSPTDPAIFAAGDIAHLDHAPRPKAGVFAVRQAPVLLHNLTVALAAQGAMRRFRPQRDYLKLISTGARGAVADKWHLPLDGAWLWRWKDRIDRRFMARFTDLPVMPPPVLPARLAEGVRAEIGDGQPACGGCGAKVGRAALATMLAGLPAPSRADVLSGPGMDAAVLAHGGGGRQVITTDHLRAFTEDFGLMARIAAIHALGDIWAMGARPQAALAQIILPPMSAALQAATLAEIMAEAAAILAAEGADLVGGHTSTGTEMTLGFTITGLADGPVIGQDGARPGDALILTKPLGTGVILAAEMARAASGPDVAATLAAMARPQGVAARILAGAGTRAMTDVTGFGLAGHLHGMLQASHVAARLDLAALPLLPGAEALAGAGRHSTLAPSNRAALAGALTIPAGARADLLFDPQTAGGLLAALPADRAAATLKALGAAGEAAAIIGEVTEGPPHLTATA